MTNHPATPPGTPREVVRHDIGGWISGQCTDAGTEPVAAEHILAGDVIVIDGTQAEVTDVRHGDFWLNTGHHAPGVALGWRAGSSSGVMFRQGSDIVQRLVRAPAPLRLAGDAVNGPRPASTGTGRSAFRHSVASSRATPRLEPTRS